MKRIYAHLIGTVGGLGHIPVIPATWTSLAIALLYGFLALGGEFPRGVAELSLPWHLGFLLFFTLAGIPACSWLEEEFGEDPRQATVDEAAGMAVTLFLVPLSWQTLALGFLLFRIFDVVKPPPARALEDLHGGFGIVADDVAAGIYARVGLGLAIYFAPELMGVVTPVVLGG